MSWPLVTLGNVAQFINGAAFKPQDWGDAGAPIIRIQNLTDPKKPFNRTMRIVNDKLRVRTGDLLVSWSATLGVFVWDRREDGLLNQHIFRVVPDAHLVDKAYLRHMLNDALVQMARHAHGATMQHVNRGEFLGTRIPLPPLPEQLRIAAILDQADELRAKRRRALALLDELADSVFVDMFDVPSTAAGLATLPRLSDYALQITDGEHQTPRRVGAGKMLLSARNVRNGHLALEDVDYVDDVEFDRISERCRPTRGDVLVSCSGSVGRVAVVSIDDPFVLVRSVALVRPAEGLNPMYLERFLRSPSLQREIARSARSSAQANLFQGPIRNLPVLVPPLDQQLDFLRLIDQIELSRRSNAAHLTKLDELFVSLQHRAFNGLL